MQFLPFIVLKKKQSESENFVHAQGKVTAETKVKEYLTSFPR